MMTLRGGLSWSAAVAVAAMLWLTAATAAANVTVEKSDGGAIVRVDGQLFAEYLTKSGHQPAVWPIIGPTGKPMTRSWPCGPKIAGEADDHPHHHSMWFTHGDVNGLDFWRAPEITPDHKDNQIKHREFVTTESLGSTAKIVTINDWMSEGKKICEDERTLTFGADRHARWIDFDITIKATEGDLKFGDTKEGTFGVRVNGPLTVDSKQGAHIINSRAQVDEKAWGMFADWIDDYGKVDGQMVGVAMFSHPDNFRNPTRWHARTYGLLAANPFGEGEFPTDSSQSKQGAFTLPKGEELTLKYRVMLHRGDPVEAQVASAYEAYVGEAAAEKEKAAKAAADKKEKENGEKAAAKAPEKNDKAEPSDKTAGKSDNKSSKTE